MTWELHVQAFFTQERHFYFRTALALDFCILLLIVLLHILIKKTQYVNVNDGCYDTD